MVHRIVCSALCCFFGHATLSHADSVEAGELPRRRICFVTQCCAGRRREFRDEEKGQLVLKALMSCSARDKFTLHAYCVMPDHLHVVAEGAATGCDLSKSVHSFKQRTGFQYRQACGQPHR
jgi:REP element-mobilizing transposase RayT